MDHPVQAWLKSTGDQTRTLYERHIKDFLEYRQEHEEIESTSDAVCNFIENLKDDGMMVSTLRSLLSPLKTFIECVERKDFYEENPIFMRVMDQWEKKEQTKKSQVISRFCLQNCE